MLLFHLVVSTLAFASFIDGGAATPHRSGSNGDRYREGAARGDPPAEMARFSDKDATDQGLVFAKETKRHTTINHQFIRKSRQEVLNKPPTEMDANAFRNKRSYYPYVTYTYQIPQFQSISAWRPSIFPLQRPYYVPVYGIDNRIPVYYPVQPFYVNPGTPPHNPAKPPYVAPTYLPPVPPQNETTTMPTDNRFGNNDDDDRPVWDDGNDQNEPSTSRPSIVPTRKPVAPGRTAPPLVHTGGSGTTSNTDDTQANRIPNTTLSPPSESRVPSRCVWAIISCCSTASPEVSNNCFEQLGCSGPFWDSSPCETDYAKAAIESALNYYNSRT